VGAAHDLSEGGLLVAVSEMLFAPDRTHGARLDLGALGAPRTDALLFGESQGRAVIAAKPGEVAPIIAAAGAAGVSAFEIGEVDRGAALSVTGAGFGASWPVADLRIAWETSIENAMRRPGLE
jgi:phosphoribosylformylglycinamidine (FGAM) synthase-like enzyme